MPRDFQKPLVSFFFLCLFLVLCPLNISCRADNLSIQKGGLLVGKVLDVAKDGAGGFGSQSLFGALLGLPLEDGLDAVFAVVGHLDDRPPLEAELAPVLLDKRHVGREVVVHVELCSLGVDDLGGGVSVLFGVRRMGKTRGPLRKSFQQALWIDLGVCVIFWKKWYRSVEV